MKKKYTRTGIFIILGLEHYLRMPISALCPWDDLGYESSITFDKKEGEYLKIYFRDQETKTKFILEHL